MSADLCTPVHICIFAGSAEPAGYKRRQTGWAAKLEASTTRFDIAVVNFCVLVLAGAAVVAGK